MKPIKPQNLLRMMPLNKFFEKLELNKILQRSLTNKTTDILSAWGALEILSPVTFNKKRRFIKS